MDQDNKRCPFCYEEIHARAVKCKHCKTTLGGTVPSPDEAATEDWMRSTPDLKSEEGPPAVESPAEAPREDETLREEGASEEATAAPDIGAGSPQLSGWSQPAAAEVPDVAAENSPPSNALAEIEHRLEELRRQPTRRVEARTGRKEIWRWGILLTVAVAGGAAAYYFAVLKTSGEGEETRVRVAAGDNPGQGVAEERAPESGESGRELRANAEDDESAPVGAESHRREEQGLAGERNLDESAGGEFGSSSDSSTPPEDSGNSAGDPGKEQEAEGTGPDVASPRDGNTGQAGQEGPGGGSFQDPWWGGGEDVRVVPEGEAGAASAEGPESDAEQAEAGVDGRSGNSGAAKLEKLGEAALKAGRYEDSLELFERALQAGGDRTRLEEKIAVTREARRTADRKRQKERERRDRERQEEEEARAKAVEAARFASLGKEAMDKRDYDHALSLLGKARDVGGETPELLSLRNECKRRRNQGRGAEAAGHKSAGVQAMKRKDYDLAIEHFRKAIELGDGSTDTRSLVHRCRKAKADMEAVGLDEEDLE